MAFEIPYKFQILGQIVSSKGLLVFDSEIHIQGVPASLEPWLWRQKY